MNEDRTDLEDVVADYLRKHPEFLTAHPELLEHLQLEHGSGSAVSLIERQVERLRDSNEELRDRLNRLVRVAAENEALMSRLHRLTLDVVPVADTASFFERLARSLHDDFGIDALCLCLFDAAVDGSDPNVRIIARDDGALDPFRAVIDRGEALCGRLAGGKLEFLFGADSERIKSTALVPLGDQGRDGLMALGSADPDRFFPGMGTLFLGLLADVISARLALSRPAERRRSA